MWRAAVLNNQPRTDEPAVADGTSPDTVPALALAERLAAGSSRALGDLLASAILHGSLILGDYVPGQSDVDLLLIVDRPLRRAEIDRLVRVVAGERAHALGPVDVRVITRDVAAAPPEIPPMELYVRFDPGVDPEIVTHHPGEPDLIVELSLCRQCGRALVGAPPRELIAEVPDRWVLQAGSTQLERWQVLIHDDRNAALMVLAACRLWCFAETGSHFSKSAAAHWALARDPSLQAVGAALGRRAGEHRHIDPSDVAHGLRIAREQIAILEDEPP